MPQIIPQVVLEIGLLSGSTVPAPYLILDDPTRGLLGTGTLSPPNLTTDISPYLNAFTCSRGSQSVTGPLISYDAGNATITLINQDGRFDPDNYLGPYTAPAGTWAGISCLATPADTSHVQVATADSYKMNTGDWVQFTAQPGGYQITGFGAPSGGQVAVAITPATPGLVTSGTASQYQTLVTPGPFVRLRGIWGGVSFPIWSGFVTDWDPQYSGPAHSYCVITAQDGLGYLNQAGLRPVPLGAVAGAGELSGARINRILDSAGWPSGTGYRDIDAGTLTMQGTLLSGAPLAELQLVTDSELGAFFMAADGRATFRDRHSMAQRSTSMTSQGLFGSLFGVELPYMTRTLAHQSVRLVNTVPVQTADPASVLQTISDATSVARYGTRAYPRSDLLLQTDADAFQWASLIIYQCKDPEQWYQQLVIDPRGQPATLFPQILARDIGHRITINRRPPGMPLVSRDSFVRGITHNYGPGANNWQTTWQLQSASKYSFLILGDATRGVLDHSRLA